MARLLLCLSVICAAPHSQALQDTYLEWAVGVSTLSYTPNQDVNSRKTQARGPVARLSLGWQVLSILALETSVSDFLGTGCTSRAYPFQDLLLTPNICTEVSIVSLGFTAVLTTSAKAKYRGLFRIGPASHRLQYHVQRNPFDGAEILSTWTDDSDLQLSAGFNVAGSDYGVVQSYGVEWSSYRPALSDQEDRLEGPSLGLGTLLFYVRFSL